MGAWESARDVAGPFKSKNEPPSVFVFGVGNDLRGEIPPACRNKLFMQFCIIRAAEHRVPCLYGEDVRIILLDSYV
jgi:hypothetical protein